MAKEVLDNSGNDDEERSKSSWFVIVLVFWFSFVYFVGGVEAIWSAVTSSAIADPPALIIDTDAGVALDNIEPDTTVSNLVQVDDLTATGPRLVWSFATALKLFGFSGLAAAFGVALYKLKFVSVFSKEIFGLVHIALLIAIAPIFGETIRSVSAGWIAGAYGAVGVNDFQAQGVNPLGSVWAFWGLYIAASFVLRQGMALKAFKDETV